jgi:hypothetical protein
MRAYAALVEFGPPFLKQPRTEVFTTTSRLSTIGSFVHALVKFFSTEPWFHPVVASNCSLQLGSGINLCSRLAPTILEWRSGYPVTVIFVPPSKPATTRKSRASAPTAALTKQCSICSESKGKEGFAPRQWTGSHKCRDCTTGDELKKAADGRQRKQAAAASSAAATTTAPIKWKVVADAKVRDVCDFSKACTGMLRRGEEIPQHGVQMVQHRHRTPNGSVSCSILWIRISPDDAPVRWVASAKWVPGQTSPGTTMLERSK